MVDGSILTEYNACGHTDVEVELVGGAYHPKEVRLPLDGAHTLM